MGDYPTGSPTAYFQNTVTRKEKIYCQYSFIFQLSTMRKRIADLTTAEMREQMSIAGNPEKLTAMMQEILGVMSKVDSTNAAELINLEFVMQRMLAESRTWIRIYEQRTGQKIS